MVPPALVATESPHDRRAWSGTAYLGVPTSDGNYASVIPEDLGKWLDYINARKAVPGAVDMRLLVNALPSAEGNAVLIRPQVLIFSTWSINLSAEQTPIKFTPEYVAKIKKRYLGDPHSAHPSPLPHPKHLPGALAHAALAGKPQKGEMRPPMWEASLQQPFPPEKRREKGLCCFVGCSTRESPLNPAVEPFAFCQSCTSGPVRLLSELPASPLIDEFKEQLRTPNLLLALVGSFVDGCPLSATCFDRLVERARDYLAVAGAEQVHPALIRHMHKLLGPFTESGALFCANQRHQLSAEQAEKLKALGVTDWGAAIPLAKRRSFPDISEWCNWGPDTILLQRKKKERILIRWGSSHWRRRCRWC